MNSNKEQTISLIVIYLVIFAQTALAYYALQTGIEALLYNTILAQLITLCAIAIIYILIPIIQKPRKISAVPEISTIVQLSEKDNAILEEYTLDIADKTSMLICKGETIYFSLTEGNNPSEEYAILNKVDQYWYIESLTTRVGIKRAREQYVYKLKPKMPYKLQKNDIIYIEKIRLLIT